MKTRAAILALAAFGAAAIQRAETVTLPAAASIVGGAPFFSDVRAFNPSYSDPLDVTATYRCFIGNPCPAEPPTLAFRLAPRESIGFDDVVAAAFNAPDTAGGIEFAFAGDPTALVVTSRLYSTSPVPTVGMYIPGLDRLLRPRSHRPHLDPQRRLGCGIPHQRGSLQSRRLSRHGDLRDLRRRRRPPTEIP